MSAPNGPPVETTAQGMLGSAKNKSSACWRPLGHPITLMPRRGDTSGLQITTGHRTPTPLKPIAAFRTEVDAWTGGCSSAIRNHTNHPLRIRKDRGERQDTQPALLNGYRRADVLVPQRPCKCPDAAKVLRSLEPIRTACDRRIHRPTQAFDQKPASLSTTSRRSTPETGRDGDRTRKR